MKLTKDHIVKAGFSLEDTRADTLIFLMNDMIFAQKIEDQIDIIYELSIHFKQNYMILVKYSDGCKGITLYEGPADKSEFDKLMKKIK